MRYLLLAVALFALAPLRAADPAPLRLGIIGLDTSHVTVFTKTFNDATAPGHVPGGKVVAAFKSFSPDVESSASRVEGYTKDLTEKYGVKLYDSVEELAKNVDAILIENVDGRPHLELFRKTLAAKKPVYIDKPLAGSLKDAVEIVRLAREAGVPIFSSSSLRYPPETFASKFAKIGDITSVYSIGPAEFEPHHPDFFWYGIHCVEALYTVLGPGCVSVTRTHTDNTDVITGVWSDGRVGTAQGNRKTFKGYGVTAVGTKGVATAGEKQGYGGLTAEIMKFFQTRVSPVAPETTLEIMAFMEAADESKRRGGAPVRLADVLKSAGYVPAKK
ncbi:MAG: Gfo/Idh/MocA family oxidoreductase [Verrucomicrobia bacterium]|nr:Gfo/Idh/MocA family oxidoreductase [Verrucomicrobiota bacterium]